MRNLDVTFDLEQAVRREKRRKELYVRIGALFVGIALGLLLAMAIQAVTR